MDGVLSAQRWSVAVVAAAVLLVMAGWLAVVRSEQLTASSGRLLRQQVVWSALALAALTAAAATDYRRVGRKSYWIYGAVLLALAAVYLFPAVNGARRWIRLAGIGIQPSEFAKLAFILALARYLVHRDLGSRFVAVLWPLAMAIFPMLLILKEPDLGTSLVFAPVLFAMLFASGARGRDLTRLTIAALLLLPLLWSQMSREQRSRVTALWEQNGPRQSATPDGFHLDQAKRMFAIGGVRGSYFAGDTDDSGAMEPAARVPEPHTDSVFCILGERFGLLGTAAVLLLFLTLVAGCLQVAARSDDQFGRLVAAGIAALFATEALINTGMLVGLLPITGLSLPLVSYGGSGLMAHSLALGVVVSIGRGEHATA